MPLFGLVFLAQVACVIHAIKTGRGQTWIYVIVFLPGAGVAAYVIAEILPELFGSRAARKLGAEARRFVDPERELREAEDALAQADTVANRLRFAEACLSLGRAAEAVSVLQESLTGLHADDPALLSALARAHFAAGDPARTLERLDRLQAAVPDARLPESHLLYARALEALGRDDEAEAEYRAVIAYFPGEEARCRYALLLERRGAAEAARTLFREILDHERRAGRPWRAAQREWADIARQRLG